MAQQIPAIHLCLGPDLLPKKLLNVDSHGLSLRNTEVTSNLHGFCIVEGALSLLVRVELSVHVGIRVLLATRLTDTLGPRIEHEALTRAHRELLLNAKVDLLVATPTLFRVLLLLPRRVPIEVLAIRTHSSHYLSSLTGSRCLSDRHLLRMVAVDALTCLILLAKAKATILIVAAAL